MIQRRKRNSSKINLTISAIFHSALILVVFVFAAREGMLGKKLKEITVTMVPKDKKPEPPKEKPPEPKVETKTAEAPKPVLPAAQAVAPPPPSDAAPSVAPAASTLAGFEFNDGAHAVESISDPNTIYKTLVEHSLRSHWNRPEDIADDSFHVDVELTVEKDGTIDSYRWINGSGDQRWDKSVKDVVASTKTIGRAPPKGFPHTFIVRFDVQSDESDNPLQLSSR